MEQVSLIRTEIARTGEIPLVVCEPPEPMRQELLGMADDILRERIIQLPSSIRIFDPRAEDVKPSDAIVLKGNIRFIRALFSSSWLLVFTALGLIMALRIRSFQDLARWWGYPLLASGIALFLLVLVVSEPFSRRVVRALDAIDLPEILRPSIEGIAHNMQEVFVGIALLQFILLIGSGIGLLLVAYLLRRRAQTRE
jgi:hypothetical protein